MAKAYQKIYALGHRLIKDIFEDEVEITEKLDGSQFGFGKVEGETIVRSKGRIIPAPEAADKLFQPAVQHVLGYEVRLPEGFMFYGETLCGPKHNVLAYERVPTNNIALYAIYDQEVGWINAYGSLKTWAEYLDIDVVPLIFQGKITAKEIPALLERESYLGKTKIEGVVVKNYVRGFEVGGMPYEMSVGKFVSGQFKERHTKKKYKGKSKWEEFMESFQTEARWYKAVQFLREEGLLLGEPKDIGPLMKRVNEDIIEEDKEAILNALWKFFGKDLLRHATRGLPTWYKEKLLKGEINV